MRTILALPSLAIPLFAFAVDSPLPTVSAHVVSWPAITATAINVHRSDDSFVETLPGTETVWIAPVPGTYYLVATDGGSWNGWARSEPFTVRTTAPVYFDADDVQYRTFRIREVDGELRWDRPAYEHSMNIHTIHGEYVATVAADVQQWVPEKTGYYYLVASTGDDWESWESSRATLVTVAEDDSPFVRLRVEGNAIVWNSMDGALSINIHDGDGAYRDTVSASLNEWRPTASGRYYVVATNAGDWRDWARSNTVSFDLDGQQTESALTVDDHVALVGEVLDIFRGARYGSEMLGLPGYSNPAYDDDRVFESSGIFSETCDNGGTGLFIGRYTGSFTQTARWDFLFDDCLDGADLFNGNFQRRSLPGIYRHGSSGLTIENQVGTTRYSGDIQYWNRSFGGEPLHYVLTDVSYASTRSASAFELEQANFLFYSAAFSSGEGVFRRSFSGSFHLTGEATKGQTLTVAVVKAFSNGSGQENTLHKYYLSGELLISSTDGSFLRLDADNDDPLSVDIEINSDGHITDLTQPWSLWENNLELVRDLNEG